VFTHLVAVTNENIHNLRHKTKGTQLLHQRPRLLHQPLHLQQNLHLQQQLQVRRHFHQIFVDLQLQMLVNHLVHNNILRPEAPTTEKRITEQVNNDLCLNQNDTPLMPHQKLNSGQFFGHLLMQLLAAAEWQIQQNF
jgi:hypothetical protein